MNKLLLASLLILPVTAFANEWHCSSYTAIAHGMASIDNANNRSQVLKQFTQAIGTSDSSVKAQAKQQAVINCEAGNDPHRCVIKDRDCEQK